MILHPFSLSCSVQLASHADGHRGSSRVPVSFVTSQKNVSKEASVQQNEEGSSAEAAPYLADRSPGSRLLKWANVK